MTFCIDTFEQCCIQKEKLVGMGTDGASNMVGVKKGLAALMKQRVNPSMVNIHCLAHRLELAFRDVLKSNKLYERLMTLLIGLHYFYKKYYKNKSGLLRAMKAVDIKGTLPPKVTGTRWLPHLQKGLKSLFKTFKAYEAHLSTLSHTNPKAEGMLKMLLDRELVAFALFLQSTLEPLMTLSMKLQSPKITLADSMFWVETQADLLDEVKLREMEDVNEVLSNGTFQKVQLKGREPTMRYKGKIIDSLKESMLRRFDWEDTSVINATKITNLYKWPACDNPAFIEFGVEEVRLFGQHFQSTLENAYPGYDVETAVGEWRTLKRAATKRYGCKLIQMTWAEILDVVELPMIGTMVDLMLTIPPTSVHCETTFSQLKLIKTARRTNLSPSTLDILLTVKLQSPSITDFKADVAIDQWLMTKHRKPEYVRKARGPQSESSDQSVTDIVTVETSESTGPGVDDIDDDDDELDTLDELLSGKDCDDDFYDDFMSEENTFASILSYMRGDE